MNGLLGSYNLVDNLVQSVARCTTDRYASATLNLCNRSNSETCFVDIAVTTIQNAIGTDSRYLEYNTRIGPNSSFSREGIIISAGEFLTVVYRGRDPRCLSANVWAVQTGEDAGTSAIVLVEDPAPVVVTTSLPNADQDVAYSQQIVATDNRDIVDYSIVAGALPTGLSLANDTGIISGIPTGVDQDYTFTVRVTDSTDGTTDQELTITKLPNSTPPVWITTSTLGPVEANKAFSLQLEVDEIGEVTFALVSGSLPSGLSLSSSGLISGTATVEETTSFTVSATNASGVAANQSFNISVFVPLYAFSTATFTNSASASLRDGPTLVQAQAGLTGPETDTWEVNTAFFNTSSGTQLWTVPIDGTYRIEARGAQGGMGGNRGGFGAIMKGTFVLARNDVIRIVVGEQGQTGGHSQDGNPVGAGGGGTFVVKAPYNTNESILVIAGGGGGGANNSWSNQNGLDASTGPNGVNNGSGSGGGTAGGGGTGNTTGGPGAGFFTNGAVPSGTPAGDTAQAFVNGSRGGRNARSWGGTEIFGGFGGGGGGGGLSAGGGGGYSGGAAGVWTSPQAGGGGGSYNNGTDQDNSVGNTGDGSVIITLIS